MSTLAPTLPKHVIAALLKEMAPSKGSKLILPDGDEAHGPDEIEAALRSFYSGESRLRRRARVLRVRNIRVSRVIRPVSEWARRRRYRYAGKLRRIPGASSSRMDPPTPGSGPVPIGVIAKGVLRQIRRGAA